MSEEKTLRGKMENWTKLAGAVVMLSGFVAGAYQVSFGKARETWDYLIEGFERTEEVQASQRSMQAAQQKILIDMADILKIQAENIERIEQLEKLPNRDPSPALRFPKNGHSITDGAPGSVVRITWNYYKLRDCGTPRVALFLRNGGDLLHRFQDISILNNENRGVRSEVDPYRMQSISYTARIPGNEGVEAGRAVGWVEVSYPESCPTVAPVVSPEVSFEILEE